MRLFITSAEMNGLPSYKSSVWHSFRETYAGCKPIANRSIRLNVSSNRLS